MKRFRVKGYMIIIVVVSIATFSFSLVLQALELIHLPSIVHVAFWVLSFVASIFIVGALISKVKIEKN